MRPHFHPVAVESAAFPFENKGFGSSIMRPSESTATSTSPQPGSAQCDVHQSQSYLRDQQLTPKFVCGELPPFR